MKIRKKAVLGILIIFIVSIFAGCTTLDNIGVKLGFRNNDFEFMNGNKVDKVVIESTRGPGFRFVASDKMTIKELYGFLSSSKKVPKKSELKPDYIFEMHIGSEVKKFSYVVGVAGKGVGNFYDENGSYVVSKRIDNDIIQNLSFTRKPRDFEKVYYPTIIDVMKKEKDTINSGDKKIGIDIDSDIECAQYVLSIDMEEFNNNLKKEFSNAVVMDKDRENYDVIVSLKNEGFTTTTYKTLITIEDKKEKSQTNYYVKAKNDVNKWKIDILTEKPSDW